MRKLLNTLYVVSEDYYLSLENKNAVVSCNHEEISRLPLHTLETIITFSRKGISVPLIEECSRHSIPVFLMSPKGTLIAEISAPSQGNILLRKQQYRISDGHKAAPDIATAILTGKVDSQKHLLSRFLWEHGNTKNISELKEGIRRLSQITSDIRPNSSMTILRGLEGMASAVYYSCFDNLILNGSEEFRFHGRSKRPPLDRVNAMLSFAYTILYNECIAALESTGLDASAGFLHDDRPGRKSLACDLVEEFRASIADRFVLSMINKGTIQAKHFEHTDSNGIYLNQEGKRLFLKHWQDNKRKELTHPYLNEEVLLGLLPYVQATLLTKTIRGEIPSYIPFSRR